MSTIEIIKAKNSQPTARAVLGGGRKVWLHSAYDPAGEAASLVANHKVAEAGAVVILGMGLGHHVVETLRLIGKDTPLLVVEANGELTALAREHNPAIPWERFAIAENEQEVRDFLTFHWQTYRHKELVIIEHPASLRIDPGYYEKMRQRVRDYVCQIVVHIATSKKLNRSVQDNIFANLPHVVGDPGIGCLTGVFQERPAVVVAAGPSLDKNIHFLKKAKNKSVIIAVSTALKAVLAQGLHPDLVVTVDPSEAQYRLFAGLEPTEAFLCYEPQAHRGIPPLFNGQRFTFNSYRQDLQVWLRELYGLKGYIEPGSSVAVAAFGIACLLGCDPVVFIGQDLAYTGGFTHASNTHYEGQRGTIVKESIGFMEVPAIGGGKVWTRGGLYDAIVRFEELFAEQAGRRLIIDATEGGALKRETQVMTFRDALDKYFTTEFPVKELITAQHRCNTPDPAARARVCRTLAQTARQYDRFIADLRKVLSLAAEVEDLRARGSSKTSALSKSVDKVLEGKVRAVNAKINAVDKQKKLKKLLSLLTFDVDILSPLPKNAPFKEQLARVEAVYEAFLEAAQITRKQLLEAARSLESRTVTSGLRGNEEEVKVAADG